MTDNRCQARSFITATYMSRPVEVRSMSMTARQSNSASPGLRAMHIHPATITSDTGDRIA
jgi:hypothetical protein